MSTITRIIILILTAAALASCGHSDTFRVDGMIDDGSSINLRVVAYTDRGPLTGITASNKGKFVFESRSAAPAIVELYDNDYRLLARFAAKNGQDIDLAVCRTNPYLSKAKGNDISTALSAFYNANASLLASDSTDARNAAIARFVADNPADIAAQIALVCDFDASTDHSAAMLADSLIHLIDSKTIAPHITAAFADMAARTGSDTTARAIGQIPYLASGNRRLTFSPADHRISLLAFSNTTSRSDSITPTLRRIHRRAKSSELEIYDFNFDADTTAWRRLAIRDSATWQQGWIPAALASPGVDILGIPSLPYFILVDSAGSQLWRGKSYDEAYRQVIKQL